MVALLGNLCFLGAFICAIFVAVQAFKRQQPLLGVLCILCTIVAVILAWTKQHEWGISKNLAIALTVLFVAGAVLTGAGLATSGTTVVVP